MAIGTDKKTKFYEGEMRYRLIMDFVNVYQETFFRVGEESTPNEEPKKPWMTEKFPEYTKESAGTLCFNVDGALCVLVIDKEKPSENIQNIMNSIQNYLNPKISRGIKYKFGWINSSTQNSIMNAFGLNKGDGPKLVLINRGTRKRFHLYDGEITEDRYGRKIPKHSHGTIRLDKFSSSSKVLREHIIKLFDSIINKDLYVRRVYVIAGNLKSKSSVKEEKVYEQIDLFTDYESKEKSDLEEEKSLEEDNNLQEVLLGIKNKYGKNSIVKGMNLEEGGTAIERNGQVGGHRG